MVQITTLDSVPTPDDFYNRFVKPRQPVLVRGFSSRLSGMTLEEYLKVVGDDHKQQTVEVNHTEVTSGRVFSPQQSAVVQMPFADLVEKLKSGSTQYYLTTQLIPVDEEGRPALYTTPVKQLVEKKFVELRPALLGNLIPMTYNLWIGRSNGASDSSSSGLHHDYHDNLYLLLQGEKRFRLAPPSVVHKLTTKGTLHTLHDNGRIVYKEQVEQDGMIRPDGALEKVERLLQLEIRKEEMEQKLEDGSAKNKEELETELNAIEEEILAIEMGEPDGEDEGKELLFGGAKLVCGQDDGDEDDESEEGSRASSDIPNAKRAKLDPDESVPLNFVLEGSDKVSFDEVCIQEGDALYLPAGWFHEVFSKGSQGGLHIAFNYWLHPPDINATFEKPYVSSFWQHDWDARGIAPELQRSKGECG